MKFAVTFTVALATCVAGNSWLGNAGMCTHKPIKPLKMLVRSWP